MTQNIQWLILMGTSFVVSVYLQTVREYSAIKTGVDLHRGDGRPPDLVARGRAIRQAARAEDADRVGLPAHARRDRAADRAGRRVVEHLAFVPGLFLVGFGLGGMLTPSVNVVQSSFPEDQQGEISGLSRSVSNLGSSFGTAIAGTILVAAAPRGNGAYAGRWAVPSRVGLIGLVAALLLPARVEPQET